MAGRWVGRRRETDSSTEPVGGLHPPYPGKLCTLLRGVRRASMSPLQRLPRSRCTGSGQGSWGSWVVPLLPMGNRILYYQRFLYDLPSQGFGAAPVNICTCFLAQFSSVSQLCPTLCNPMDCSPPGASVHGIFQARILEWVAISSSRGCLLRNLYAGQQATFRTGHGKTDWFKIGKEYVKAVYCQSAYLTSMQGTSCKIPGWMKHKLGSRLLEEISITSDM